MTRLQRHGTGGVVGVVGFTGLGALLAIPSCGVFWPIFAWSLGVVSLGAYGRIRSGTRTK